jgi:hypothetical protein
MTAGRTARHAIQHGRRVRFSRPLADTTLVPSLAELSKSTGCEVVFVQHPHSEDQHDQLLLQIQGAVITGCIGKGQRASPPPPAGERLLLALQAPVEELDGGAAALSAVEGQQAGAAPRTPRPPVGSCSPPARRRGRRAAAGPDARPGRRLRPSRRGVLDRAGLPWVLRLGADEEPDARREAYPTRGHDFDSRTPASELADQERATSRGAGRRHAPREVIRSVWVLRTR